MCFPTCLDTLMDAFRPLSALPRRFRPFPTMLSPSLESCDVQFVRLLWQDRSDVVMRVFVWQWRLQNRSYGSGEAVTDYFMRGGGDCSTIQLLVRP